MLMLFDLRLPSFDTLIHNYWYIFNVQWSTCVNSIICQLNVYNLHARLVLVYVLIFFIYFMYVCRVSFLVL